MNNKVAVIVEHENSRVSPATLEAVAFAQELALITGSIISCVIVGGDALEISHQLAHELGIPCEAVVVPGLSHYDGEAYRWALVTCFGELFPDWVCVAGTTQGLDLAPGLAVRINAGCLANVEKMGEKDHRPVFSRSLFNGKVYGDFIIEPPAVLITQPGSFRYSQKSHDQKGHVQTIHLLDPPGNTRLISESRINDGDSGLSQASVIISAGRGIKSRENLALLKQAAGMFSRSSVAGSRPLCDDGWLPYNLQVGQTGAEVSPELYVACGISGAQQHLTGMRGSKFVVSINTDPNAPIFNESDIGIVDDFETFLNDFIEAAQDRS